MSSIQQPVWLNEEEAPSLPKEWRYLTTEEACLQLKPGKLFENKTVNETGRVPVINQSADGIIGFHDEEPGVNASPSEPVVTFANHTCAMRLMKQPFSCIQNIFPKIGRPGVADTRYFYYASLGRVSISDYKGHHPVFRESLIPVPPLPTQRKIADILSAYDDLIENNLRRIEILKKMAQCLYREWFVHFRFPGYDSSGFADSALGQIPKGWEVRTIEELVKRIPVGKKYDQKTANKTGAVPIFDQGKAGVIGYHDDQPGVEASETEPVIVFANHTCYQRLIHYPFSAIQNVLPFHPSPLLLRNIYWLHYATNGRLVLNDYKGHWPEFAALLVIVPPAEVCQRFGAFVGPLSLQMLRLERAVEILRRTRDLVIPKLLSGH